jgi:TP901 family phage tail tape measure protein
MASNSTATIIFKGDDQISPAIKGATASVAGLSQSFEGVDTGAKQASDSIRENLVKQIEAARQKVSDFAKQGLKVEQGQALGELRKLQGELKKLDAPVGTNTLDPLAASANKTAVQIKTELTKSILAVNQELAKLSTQKLTPEVRLRQDQLLGQLSGLKTQLKDIDKLVVQPKVQLDPLQLNAISQSFGAIAGKLTELKGSAVAAAGAISVAERKLSTVSDESGKLIKNFGDLAAANKFQTTTAELAGASYEVLSAGFTKTADVTKILDASTKGAVGGFSDVITVSKATISALNAYGQGADQAASFVDKFVSVQQSGLITVDQYAQQIARIAPTAAAAGLSLDELNGAIATATASGVPVESTFSGLRTAIGAILKPSSEAVTLSKELGISFNAQALKTKGLSGILKELKTTGNDSADTLLKLFGSAEALAAIAPSINSIEKLEANIKASANSAGLAATNFDKAADPIKAFANQTTEALAVLGKDVLKVFNPVIGTSKAVVQAFLELPQPVREVIAFLVGGGAAIATTGAAISGFLAILSPTLAGLSALGTGVTAAIGFLTAGQVALGTATATTTGLTAAEAAAFGGVATASGSATAGVGGLTTATAGLGTAAGITAGTLGLIALAAVPLLIIGKQFNDAWGTDKVTAGLKDMRRQLDDIKAKRGELAKPQKGQDDGLGGTGINEGNFNGFINPFNTRQDEQKNVIRFSEKQNQDELNKVYEDGVSILKKYGVASEEAAKKTKLSKEQLEAFTKDIAEKKEDFDIAINNLQKQGEEAKGNPILQGQIRQRIIEFSNAKKLLDDKLKLQLETNKKVEAAEKRSSEAIEEIAKKRIDKEKQNNENQARLRGRDFEQKAKAESGAFETKSRDDKRVFEAQLNTDKKAFEEGQKADKKEFEKGLQSENKQFARDQKVEQQAFNAEEKASDKAYEREKQAAQRVFDKEQEKAKEAFDKKQRDASLAFDKSQDAAKKTADDKFAIRKLEIERKLQLDAAKTPEDKAKLEAEFKATDEKAAKEKLAFEQLKADELAFAEKQKADKIAFDERQKVDQKAEDERQKAAKQAFDDAQKLVDEQRDADKQLKKEAFEEQLNIKKEAFDAAQNLKKEAYEAGQNKLKEDFDTTQNVKKQAFEDAERAKKEAFDLAQNDKKAAFEDGERAKKQAFEDNLKALEAQFKSEERAKDIATAQQVAAIKAGSAASTVAELASSVLGAGASPRASGGRFDAGQQLLVGERGQELVTFGSGGYVSNATDTKQILSSNSNAPSSVSTARMEALLSQLVGKLDRPNVSVQTSENPSDVLIKIQREAARSAAMQSGI